MIGKDNLISNFGKIYKNEKFLFPYKYGLNKYPFYIDIEITNACNLNCIMCNRRLMTRRIGFMEFVIFKKVVDEMATFKGPVGLRFVRHGEPTVHKDLIDMICYVHKRNILTFLSTNGLLFTEKLSLALLDSGLDEVRFSTQGTNREEYRKMRNIDAFDKFESNIRIFKEKRDQHKNKTFISLSTSITDETVQQVEQFKEYWKGIVDGINIDRTTFARLEHLDNIKEYAAKQSFERKYKPCTEVMTKLSVNYNGDITPCCKDYNGQLVIGNITNRSLISVWNSKELNELREKIGEKLLHHTINMCKDCYHVSDKFDFLKKAINEKCL